MSGRGLALASVRYEWRRFLPASIAVGTAFGLILLQTAFVAGIFRAASLAIDASDANVWLASAGTAAVELGEPLPAGARGLLERDPDVLQVDRLLVASVDWRTRMHGAQSLLVLGIDPRPTGLALARLVPPAERARLRRPGALLVDPADLDALGGPQACGWADSARLCVAGTVRGLRALGGVAAIASLSTARGLLSEAQAATATYVLARVRDRRVPVAIERIGTSARGRHVAVWTADEFARATRRHWFLQTGAGAVVLLMTAVIGVAGTIIASQALASALAASATEFAMLRAFGVGRSRLVRVACGYAAWTSAAGAVAAAIFVVLTLGVARRCGVPAALEPAGVVIGAAAGILLLGGAALGSVRGVMRVEPGALLR